jgi:hypothetical protein
MKLQYYQYLRLPPFTEWIRKSYHFFKILLYLIMAGKIGIKAEEKKKLWMKTLNELKKLLAEHMEILEDRYKELQRRPQGVQFIKIQKVMEKESSK